MFTDVTVSFLNYLGDKNTDVGMRSRLYIRNEGIKVMHIQRGEKHVYFCVKSYDKGADIPVYLAGQLMQYGKKEHASEKVTVIKDADYMWLQEDNGDIVFISYTEGKKQGRHGIRMSRMQIVAYLYGKYLD